MFAVTITLLLIIITVSAISLGTPNWITRTGTEKNAAPGFTIGQLRQANSINNLIPKSTGLWVECNPNCVKNTNTSKLFNTVRVFSILTLIFSLCALISILTIKYSQWHSELFLRIFLILTGISSFVTLLVFPLYSNSLGNIVKKNTQLGYSYFIQIIVFVLIFVTTEISFYHPKL